MSVMVHIDQFLKIGFSAKLESNYSKRPVGYCIIASLRRLPAQKKTTAKSLIPQVAI